MVTWPCPQLYIVTLEGEGGQSKVLEGLTKKHRHGAVDVHINTLASNMKIAIDDGGHDKKISLYEVDVLTSLATGK